MRKLAAVGIGMFSVLLVGTGVLLLGGFFPGSDEARPPCEQLPTEAAVRQALTGHGELTRRIEALGEGVTVEVATPCPDDRALIEISFGNSAEHDAISEFLRKNDGFGVPVSLSGA